ncbi:hypothetical protein ACEPAG_2238 [Sanghuangporus baumii]
MASHFTIPSTMKGVYLPGNRRVDVRDVPVPEPGPGEVLIQSKASGICGSDLRAIYRPKVHRTGAEGYLGVIAGHEPCGVVAKRGPGVSEVAEAGKKELQWPSITFRDVVNAITAGKDIIFIVSIRTVKRTVGSVMVDMESLFFAKLVTWFAFRNLLLTLTEQYLDVVSARRLGPVGLGTALLAQKMGAKVLGLEFQPDRVAFANKLGIESIECVKGGAAGKEGEADIKAIVAWSGGDGVDVAIDCSGAANARLTCIRAARVWGRVVFVGEEGELTIDVSEDVIHKGLTIHGSWVCSTGQMEELVNLLVRWDLHPEVTITNTFQIGEADVAYKLFDKGKTGKYLLVLREDDGSVEQTVGKSPDSALIGGLVAGLASLALLILIFYVLWRTLRDASRISSRSAVNLDTSEEDKDDGARASRASSRSRSRIPEASPERTSPV